MKSISYSIIFTLLIGLMMPQLTGTGEIAYGQPNHLPFIYNGKDVSKLFFDYGIKVPMKKMMKKMSGYKPLLSDAESCFYAQDHWFFLTEEEFCYYAKCDENNRISGWYKLEPGLQSEFIHNPNFDPAGKLIKPFRVPLDSLPYFSQAFLNKIPLLVPLMRRDDEKFYLLGSKTEVPWDCVFTFTISGPMLLSAMSILKERNGTIILEFNDPRFNIGKPYNLGLYYDIENPTLLKLLLTRYCVLSYAEIPQGNAKSARISFSLRCAKQEGGSQSFGFYIDPENRLLAVMDLPGGATYTLLESNSHTKYHFLQGQSEREGETHTILIYAPTDLCDWPELFLKKVAESNVDPAFFKAAKKFRRALAKWNAACKKNVAPDLSLMRKFFSFAV